MTRSLKKGVYINKKVYKKIFLSSFKTWSRSTTIIPDMIGKNIMIYNGKKFIKIYIIEDMIGYKLGEFSPTRNFKSHSKKIKVKKNVK